jgi:hypothetical protein
MSSPSLRSAWHPGNGCLFDFDLRLPRDDPFADLVARIDEADRLYQSAGRLEGRECGTTNPYPKDGD